jgi:hypothetical protein
MDHRLAFVLLGGLVLGAGVPLAMAWVHLLPEDAAPFGSPEKATRSPGESLEPGEMRERRSDPIAVGLLVFVTISFILQFPGVPRDAVFHWLASRFDATSADLITLGARAFFAFVPGLAACYSLLRRNFLRIPLLGAGILVLLLWLFGPLLQAALVAS